MGGEIESTRSVDGGDPLARRLAAGDPTAPRELVEQHHAELHRYARALLRDAVAAEDAVQTAFEKAFVALGGYPGERVRRLRLRPWLYRIVLNVVRNAWRDGRREQPAPETPDAPEPAPYPDRREAWMDALGALNLLPERQRVAVALRYLEDLPYAEISAATGWPENTCKTLVRRGIGKLGALLSEETVGDGGG